MRRYELSEEQWEREVMDCEFNGETHVPGKCPEGPHGRWRVVPVVYGCPSEKWCGKRSGNAFTWTAPRYPILRPCWYCKRHGSKF